MKHQYHFQKPKWAIHTGWRVAPQEGASDGQDNREDPVVPWVKTAGRAELFWNIASDSLRVY